MRSALRSALGAAILSLPVVVTGLSFVPSTGFGQSLDHDSSLPIEISADSLEVEQEEQVATFVGNVDAVQGDLVLSADRLRVHYEGENRSIGLSAGQGSSIRRIDAEGHVIITSPDETAEGDHGSYDVPGKLVTLEGKVVLTRGDNVIRGERLELDLVSGKSRMVGTETTVAGSGEDGSNGRVKALFTPKAKEDDGKAVPIPEARPK